MVDKEEKFGLLLRMLETERADKLAETWTFNVCVDTPSGKGKKLFEDEKKAVFVPSERVDELVRSRELHAGAQIGYVDLTIFRDSKNIHWNFYPFYYFRERRLLEKHGIGTLIQAAIVAKLRKEKRFAGYKLYSYSNVIKPRQEQLDKMGIPRGVFYPLEEHWQKTRDYARELAKRHSRRRKPK